MPFSPRSVSLRNTATSSGTGRETVRGRMSSTIFEIYEEPQESTPEREMPHTENPCVEKPDVDNPRGDKSAQINTDQVITQERNTLKELSIHQS